MLDDFLIRALIAGIGIAALTGPLGCLVVWRRMAFFGDTLAHSSLLGIALGLIIGVSTQVAVPIVTFAICISLVYLQRRSHLPSDTVLGIVAHSTLALGLVMISLVGSYEVSVMGILLGDILSVSKQDIAIIYGGGACVLVLLLKFWRPMLASTVSPDIATAEGLKPKQSEWVFMLLIALVVAVSLKLIGALLITAMLIIPAATARRFSNTPEAMVLAAIIIGMVSIGGGLFSSLHLDTPTGPSIILIAAIIFSAVHLIIRRDEKN